MSDLRVPKEFYTERSHLFGAMKRVASNINGKSCSVEEIIRLLPRNLKETPAFRDALTGKWRYDFGDPYSIEDGKEELFGTDQCPLVEWLYRCLSEMQRVLTDTQLLEYLKRLGDTSKHLEALVECSPLLLIKKPAKIEYEVRGYGQGNKTIDFFIEHPSGISVLIDVKCRIKELINKLPEAGRPDPEGLFKSLPEKFNSQNSDMCLQGGWIHSSLKFHGKELHAEFDNTNASKLHFIILALWDKQAYILKRNSKMVEDLNTVFKFPSDDSIVING
jgi:hypothetical protein